MIISNIRFKQNVGKKDEWHLKSIELDKLNLIASRNAVGKTRMINIIHALANMLTAKSVLLNGNWDITYENDDKQLRYILEIEQGRVVKEKILENNAIFLSRSGESGRIRCIENRKKPYLERFSPPANKLTNHIRRDIKKYPYIEDLVKWAENYHTFTFSIINPQNLTIPAQIPGMPKINIQSPLSPELNFVPYLFKEIEDNETIKNNIIKDLKKVGYSIKDLLTTDLGDSQNVVLLRVIEKGVKFPIEQYALSRGMFRVIAVVITLHYLMAKEEEGAIVIDDLCEGLDYSRSLKLSSLLFSRMKDRNIQLIATTNDLFLMNSVDLKYWNILERHGSYVESFNYVNCKEIFNEFRLTGISNFEFFANKLYKGLRKDG